MTLEPTETETRTRYHELSLLLSGRCRACAERLPGGVALRGHECPLCHESAVLAGAERDELAVRMRNRGFLHAGLLAVAVGASHLLVGWLPMASTVVVGISAAWIRWRIVRPAVILLGPGRRQATTWTGRLVTAAFIAGTLIINESLTLVPFLGPLGKGVISALQVIGVAWFNAAYLDWQLRREQSALPVLWWEWSVLALTGAVLVVSTIVWVLVLAGVVVAAQHLAGGLLE